MDRKHIENEHVVDRYLSGELTVREAREFEQFCFEHPDFLSRLPIPARLKARLKEPSVEESKTLTSETTRLALASGEEGFDADEEQREWRRANRAAGPGRLAMIGLVVALLAAVAGAVTYARQASTLSAKLTQIQREAKTRQMQAPGSVQALRLQLRRGKPAEATTTIGWPVPPQLLDIYIDATDAKYNTFQITIDKVDEGRLLQLHRVARDSNRELRFKLNSSAFGPGEYLFKIDGYTWRGDAEELGWLRLDMHHP